MRVTNEALAARLDGIADDVGTLKHVLLEGNGQPSLVQRVTAVETTQRLTRGERAMLHGGTLGGIVAVIHAIVHALH